MPFADIGGLPIHYRHNAGAASAPVVVFINSLGTDFRIWDDVAARLAPAMTTVLYDKRGHGLSGVGAGTRSIDDHVDDLEGLLDHLAVAPAILCGLSIGGLIAQRFLMRLPQSARALILCDTAYRIGTAATWEARIATVENHGIEAIADAIMEKWFTPAFHRNRRSELAGYRNMLTRQPVTGYVGSCVAIRDADYADAARRISVPTLCIVGDQDGSTPPDVVRQTAALIPNARFEVIGEAGHIPCVEQPEALVSLIRQFVASLPGRAA